ncbi:MAG: signal peptidase II [Patescibacteria group bacterium]
MQDDLVIRKWYNCVVVFLLGVDLLLQRLALTGVEVGNDAVRFALLKNDGIFFQWHPSMVVVWVVIFPVAGFVVALWIHSLRQTSVREAAAWTMVILGAASNILDRLLFGFVVDYIHLWIFPVFNLPDLLILGGVLFLFFIHREQNLPA